VVVVCAGIESPVLRFARFLLAIVAESGAAQHLCNGNQARALLLLSSLLRRLSSGGGWGRTNQYFFQWPSGLWRNKNPS